MATPILEELLIALTFEIDPAGLEKARGAGKKVADTVAAYMKQQQATNKSLTQQDDKERKKASDDIKAQMIADAKEANATTSKAEGGRKKVEQEKVRAAEKLRTMTLHTTTALNKMATVARIVGNEMRRAALFGSGLMATAFAYTVKADIASASLLRFARSANISYDALQQLDYAAQSTGSKAGAMAGIMENLNKQLGEISLGRGPQAALSMLGVNLSGKNGFLKDSVEYLLRISDALKRFDPQRQADIASQLGFSQEQLQLLQRGRAGIVELMALSKKNGYVSEEAAKKALAMNEALVASKAKLQEALVPLQLFLTQFLTEWIPRISSFIKLHKDEIVPLFKKLAVFTAIMFAGSWIASFLAKLWTVIAALKVMTYYMGIAAGLKVAVGAGALGAGALARDLGGSAVISFLGKYSVAVLAVVAALTALYALKNQTEKSLKKREENAPATGWKRSNLEADKIMADLFIYGRPKHTLPAKLSVPSRHSSTSNQSTTQNVTVNINGAQDPMAIHKEFVNHMDLITRSGQRGIGGNLF